jgi:hypothetical protein
MEEWHVVKRYVCFVVVFIFVTVPGCHRPTTESTDERPKIDTSGPEFEDWLKQFVAEVRSEDNERVRKAARLFEPTLDEIKAAFPGLDKNRLRKMEQAFEKHDTERDLDEFVPILKLDYGQPGPIRVTLLRDLRKNPNDDVRVKKALEIMHPDVPLIQAAHRQGDHEYSSTYYMRINGRWVYHDSLKGFVEND